MDDDKFQHMLMLSGAYISLFKSRQFFDGIEEWYDDLSEKQNSLTCMEIVADTFIEMQRRLGVKPSYRRKAETTP